MPAKASAPTVVPGTTIVRPARGKTTGAQLPPPRTIYLLLCTCAGTAAIRLAFLSSPLHGYVAVLVALVAVLFTVALT